MPTIVIDKSMSEGSLGKGEFIRVPHLLNHNHMGILSLERGSSIGPVDITLLHVEEDRLPTERLAEWL